MSEIIYRDIDLDVVMKYFADGFEAARGKEISDNTTWFIDPVKNRAIFKLYVQPKEGE